MRIKTISSTTDLILEILEGKTLELFKPVPINVAFNAVYSEYTILPLKNLNFGPIQFNEQKTRNFEIKNDGLFEFTFNVFDYANEEMRKRLKAEQDEIK